MVSESLLTLHAVAYIRKYIVVIIHAYKFNTVQECRNYCVYSALKNNSPEELQDAQKVDEDNNVNTALLMQNQLRRSEPGLNGIESGRPSGGRQLNDCVTYLANDRNLPGFCLS